MFIGECDKRIAEVAALILLFLPPSHKQLPVPGE